MRSRQNNCAGFSALELLIAVVAMVGVIGVGGWVVYQHNATTVATATAGGTQQAPAGPAGPTVAYLHVTEWKVKLPLPDSLKDAYYVPSTTSFSADGTPNQIYLGLKSLDAYGCAADGVNRGQDSAIAMIFRALPTDTDPVSGKLDSQVWPGVTVGSYFYGYENVASSTSKTCKAPQLSISSADAAFAGAAAGIATDTTSSN